MIVTGATQPEPFPISTRIDDNLRPLFVAGVQKSLNELQESAFNLVSATDRRAGRPDFYAGIVVLNAVMQEAPKVRTGLLHRDIGSKMLLLNRSDVHESFRELSEEYRETQPELRVRLLRTYYECLQNRPERYIDPHLVIGLHKLAAYNPHTKKNQEISVHKAQQLQGLTSFMLAVQGLAASKQTHQFASERTLTIPEPRSGTKHSLARRESVLF